MSIFDGFGTITDLPPYSWCGLHCCSKDVENISDVRICKKEIAVEAQLFFLFSLLKDRIFVSVLFLHLFIIAFDYFPDSLRII